MRKSQKRPKNSTLKAKADKLFSEYTRRSGVCLGAVYMPEVKCKGGLQCAHIKSRRYTCLRWHPSNSVCLCAAHHYHSHNHPDLFISMVEANTPGTLEFLNREMQKVGGKVDLEEVISGLMELMSGVKAEAKFGGVEWPDIEPL